MNKTGLRKIVATGISSWRFVRQFTLAARFKEITTDLLTTLAGFLCVRCAFWVGSPLFQRVGGADCLRSADAVRRAQITIFIKPARWGQRAPPKELRLGKPCAGNPPARFNEGEGSERGLPPRCSL